MTPRIRADWCRGHRFCIIALCALVGCADQPGVRDDSPSTAGGGAVEALAQPLVTGGENLIVNGTFETDLAPAYGQVLSADRTQIIQAPWLISRESGDPGGDTDGTAGALRVTISQDQQYSYTEHTSGAILRLSRTVQHASSTWLDIRFRAKSVSGVRNLWVNRLWGGGKASVELTPSWRTYEVSIPLGFDSDAIVFALQNVPQGGTFLLDSVEAYEAPSLAVNGNFEATDLTPVHGQKIVGTTPTDAPEFLSRSTDTPYGSGGSLHVTIAVPQGTTMSSHTAGVVVPLSAIVPAGTWLRVGFYGKRVSGGSLVSARKLSGGSSTARARIGSQWSTYQAYLKTAQDTGSLLLNVVPADDDVSQALVSADFLIDELNIVEVDSPAQFVRCGQVNTQVNEVCEPECTETATCPAALLDTVSVQPVAAYSVSERLRSAYAGPAVRVRRNSDNVESRIGFAGSNELDTATLASFCGASDCYLATLYDQSGNGRDLDRSNNQVKLYDGVTHTVTTSGTRPVIPLRPDGTGVSRGDVLSLTGNPDMTVFYFGRYGGPGQLAAQATPILLGPLSFNYQNATGFTYMAPGTSHVWQDANDTELHRTVYLHQSGTAINASTPRVNGVPATIFGGNGTPAAFNLTTQNTAVGRFSATWTDATCELSTLVVWNAVLGESDLAKIEAQSTTPACDGVQECVNGDDCCPDGCSTINDLDCRDPHSGNICDPANPDCGSESCLANMGPLYGYSSTTAVCQNEACSDMSSPLFECGTPDALCGPYCPACTPQCDGKSCGSDGCWGKCGTGVCTSGQLGCTSHDDCASGLRCIVPNGGSNICLPEVCEQSGRNPCSDPANAGGPTSCNALFVCPACTPDCTSIECGPDLQGCGECGDPSTGPGQFCANEQTYQFDGPEFDDAPDDTISANDVTMGTLPGEFRVSSAGQATYKIPLWVPPGRNGIAPDLALNYDSSAGNGYLGMGWSLAGLSSVQRCPTTIAQDGQPDGITYSPSDRFCLDGNRLVLANDGQAYGGDGTEYRTEMETFAQVRSYGSANGEPSRFEVRTKDGRILTYDIRVGGADPRPDTTLTGVALKIRNYILEDRGAARTQRWLLSKVEDRFHNALRITYTDPAMGKTGSLRGTSTAVRETISVAVGSTISEYYPDRIEYTAHDELVSERYIKFDFKYRREYLGGFRDGVLYDRTRLLSQVTAYARGQIAAQYRLAYEEPPYGEDDLVDPDLGHERTRLRSITQCARAVATDPQSHLVCKRPTTFSYDMVEPGFAPESPGPVLDSVAASDADFVGPPLTLDLDGNGQDDVLYSSCSQTSGPCNDLVWKLLLNGQPVDVGNIPRLASTDSNGVRTPGLAFVVDYDLDGHDDVLEMDAVNRTANGGEIRRLSYVNGQIAVTNIGVALGGQSFGGRAYVLDANGDGAPDLLDCTLSAGGRGSWQLRLHDHTIGFGTATTLGFGTWGCRSATPVDIRGDGRQELLLNTGYRQSTGASGYTIDNTETSVLWPLTGDIVSAIPATKRNAVRLVLDENGDGMADVVEVADDFTVTIWLGTGVGFVSYSSSLSLENIASPFAGLEFINQLGRYGIVFDENGDGRADIITKANNSDWIVLRSTGTSFSVRSLTVSTTPNAGNRFFAYDANHDGMRDLVMSGKVFARLGPPTVRLAGITDGMHAHTRITYAPLAQDADEFDSGPQGPLYTHETSNCSYPVYCRHPVGSVVREYATWDKELDARYPDTSSQQIPPSRRLFYSYRGAAIDLTGRGSLGFSGVSYADGARNEIAASLAMGGFQVTNLSYLNKFRDSEHNIYPFVGVEHTRSDVSTTATGRLRLTVVQRDLCPGLEEVCEANPSPHSIFPHVHHQLAQVYESGADASGSQLLVSQDSTWQYDAFGNVTHSDDKWLDGNNTSVDTTYVVDEDAMRDTHVAAWLVSQPRRRTVTSTGNHLVKRAQQFIYGEDGVGTFPLSGVPEIILDQPHEPNDPGPDLQLVTAITYNRFGNVENISSTAPGLQARTIAIDYDSYQMFPEKVTQDTGQLLHDVHVEYEPGLGIQVHRHELGRIDTEVSEWTIPDGFGRVRRIQAADGTITNFDYSVDTPDGPVKTITRLGAPTQRTFYDVLGREVTSEITDFNGGLLFVDTHYNSLGLVSEVSRAHTNGASDPDFTSFSYDSLGRRLITTLPDGNVAETCYLDNVVCTRNPRGFTTCYALNERGQPTYRVEPQVSADSSVGCGAAALDVKQKFPALGDPVEPDVHNASRFVYDAFGSLLAITDPAHNGTVFFRDDFGRVVLKQDLDSGQWLHTYNAFGEVSTETDPQGRQAVFHYDGLGRLVERRDLGASPGEDQVTTWTYDYPNGTNGGGFFGQLVATETPEQNRIAITYDQFGRLDTFSRDISGDEDVRVLSRKHEYANDGTGRLSVVSYSNDTTGTALRVRYNYSPSGYLRGVSQPDSDELTNPGADTEYWTATQTDAYGQLASEHFHNNLTTTRTYFPHTGQPKLLCTSQGNVVCSENPSTGYAQHWRYEYDKNGNLSARTDLRSESGLPGTIYTYDPLDRVTDAWTGFATLVFREEHHQYDEVGNIIHKSVASADENYSWTYHYNDASGNGGPHAVDSIEDDNDHTRQIYSYDQFSGELETRGAGMRPQLAIDYNRLHLPARLRSTATSSDDVNLGYDSAGMRVHKSSPSAGGAAREETFYLDDSYSVSSVVDASGLTERLVVMAGTRPVAYVERDPGGQSHTAYLHVDHLGSVELVTSDSGSFERREHSAFGERVAVVTGPSAGDPTLGPRLDYAGHEYDSEFELVNMKARMYDATIGRFLAPDPVVSPGGQSLNPYSYVGNNPVNAIDPSGLFKLVICLPFFCPGLDADETLRQTAAWTQRARDNGGLYGGPVQPFAGGVGVLVQQPFFQQQPGNGNQCDDLSDCAEAALELGGLLVIGGAVAAAIAALVDAVSSSSDDESDEHRRPRQDQTSGGEQERANPIQKMRVRVPAGIGITNAVATTVLVAEGATVATLAVVYAPEFVGYAVAADTTAGVLSDAQSELASGAGVQAAEKVASTPMGRAIQSLRETLSSGKGPWKLNTAHAEGSVSKVYGPNATSIEEVFVHQGTGERLIRHTVVEGDKVLHETFRQFSKFE